MSRPRVALVLVDLQHWIVELSLAPIRGAQVVEACARLRADFHQAGAPVVIVRHLRKDGTDGGPSAPANQLVRPVAPREGDLVITKNELGAFEGTNLADRLYDLNVDTVVVAGIATAHGVDATAVSAASHGYGVIVVSDATASVSDQEHLAALEQLSAAGIKVCTVDEVLSIVNEPA